MTGIDSSAAVGGSYEVLRNRLAEQGRELGARAAALNETRKRVFGGSELTVVANERIRTEANCVPAEIVSIGDLLLFGYSVRLGLKKATEVADVFSLHRFARTADGYDLSAVGLDQAGGFLQDPTFVRELGELYQYYRDPCLYQLRTTTDGKLLAAFTLGESTTDTKVFRWALDVSGRATYIDSRGERDWVFPPSHDFEWTPTGREDQVPGRHPHVSILDEVFIDTVGGDLTIKIENSTEDGFGVFREPVQEASQSLDDAQFAYAKLGALILIKVLPYREEAWRYYVFNTRTKAVVRIDAIARACVQLPEDHGIIFPGGYYLQTGVYKLFDDAASERLEFQQAVRSPNGEDVLYVYLTRAGGTYTLFPYNLIRKEVATPIHCHGYTIFADGTMVVFRAVSDEPTRVHPMQIWKTPFTSAEHAASAETDGSFLAKVGNADLVRGISDALSVRRLTETPGPPVRHVFEDLVAATTRMIDGYYWLGHAEVGDLAAAAREVRKTAELIIDEFEKVEALEATAAQALADARAAQAELVRGLRPESWRELDRFMAALSGLRSRRGHLISLREVRFMDLAAVDELEQEAIREFDRISAAAAAFLGTDKAFVPLERRLDALLERIAAVTKSPETVPIREEIDRTADGLTVLTEVAGGLGMKLDDPTARTAILESISEVYAQVNRVRATLEARRRELLGTEGRAEFAAQFKLLGQSVDSALARADTPEACDEQLSLLMLQLEELEGKFAEFDEFAARLAARREEVYEALAARKQTLVEERQRRAQNLFAAAERILQGVGRRARTFEAEDELNAYFSSDPMLLKARELAAQLAALGDSVRADEVEGRLKSARQDALRLLRDRAELFETGDQGEAVIKLGRHRFSVNAQPLDLALLPRGDGLAFHLTGTDFYEPADDPRLEAARDLWDMTVASETREVYRAEHLAASILAAAEQGRDGLDLPRLEAAARAGDAALLELVRRFAADRYDEGYERGVHDADAAKILATLVSLRAGAGLLRFPATARALAVLAWAALVPPGRREPLQRKARSLGRLRAAFGASAAAARDAFGEALGVELAGLLDGAGVEASAATARAAGLYLAEELAAPAEPIFALGAEAARLRDAFLAALDAELTRSAFEDDLRALADRPGEALELAAAWIDAFLAGPTGAAARELAPARLEAAVALVTEGRVSRSAGAASAMATVTGLLGQHPRIAGGALEIRLDELLDRLAAHARDVVPRYRDYRKLRADLTERQRAALRLDEFKPRVLTSFVRNRLINEVYLPLVGDNLAKQLGTVGETKRTDLMGLLLLVSPPGYGKTTLMEYVASQLGLVFIKVNGPSLGHGVTSLDPAEAPNATARQEVEKIGLALEMGNNVMLYLDDIQHTSPELLQKFISLCDAQRRVEGVWRGRTRTYDLRGKKFCMVMAGNPYTESGERFQIPDMLANRADTYNLGEVLEGKERLFELSYIENALTSSPTLAPLASRAQGDLYALIRMAHGEEVAPGELSHPYSAAEIADIVAVLRHLEVVQRTLLRVNAQYIASAAQDDAYRTEPPFQLQGSYRNMTKLAEKVVPALNEAELERLIDDHYQGEAQTLTSGAEHNLLKLAELRGRMSEAQRARWAEIKAGFQRLKRLGGAEDDPAVRVVGQLNDIGERLGAIRDGVQAAAARKPEATPAERSLAETLKKLDAAIATLRQPRVELSLETSLPQPMSTLMERQVALVEGVLKMIYSTTRSLEEGGAISVQLMAVLNDLRAITDSLRPAAPLDGAPPAVAPEHRER